MVKERVYVVFGIICKLARCLCIGQNIKMHFFFAKHLLWLTHAGVIPCVKTNDISRISSEKWYLKNFNKRMISWERWEIRWGEWGVVVTGGRTGRRHGDGWRWQWPPCQIVRQTSFFNCPTMRLWEIMMNKARPYLQMWRGVWVSFLQNCHSFLHICQI